MLAIIFPTEKKSSALNLESQKTISRIIANITEAQSFKLLKNENEIQTF